MNIFGTWPPTNRSKSLGWALIDAAGAILQQSDEDIFASVSFGGNTYAITLQNAPSAVAALCTTNGNVATPRTYEAIVLTNACNVRVYDETGADSTAQFWVHIYQQ